MADWKVVASGPAEVSSETQNRQKTPERKHVNALLEFSEEEFMKDLEPNEYHCYQSWEEAVCGWGRVAPLASILLAEKTGHKPKRKDAGHGSSTAAEPKHFTELSSERTPTRSSSTSSQHMWNYAHTVASHPTPDSPEIPLVEDLSKTITQLALEDQTKDIRTPFPNNQVISKCNLTERRSPKPRKNSLKTNNALVPIKNFTFLPPIEMSPNFTGNKHHLYETGMESFFIIDKINRIRRTKGDLHTELPKDAYNEAISSKSRTCQHNPNYYSAVSVSVPRYHVAVSSKPETLHPTGYSVSKALRTNTANRHPSYLYSS